MAIDGITQRNFLVSVAVADQSLGTFDSFSGGEVDSEELKYSPGGMADEISLGGRKSVGNVTVSRIYTLTRDHTNLPWLLGQVGKGSMTVVKHPLNADRVPVGAPSVYTGTLKRVTPPEHDSSGNDEARIELEMTSVGVS